MVFMPKIADVFSLYMKMLLAFGVDLPDADARCSSWRRMGMVTAGFLLRAHKYAVLVIFILGAVLSRAPTSCRRR